MAAWIWNGKREQAAMDVAQDDLTDVQIADRAAVTKWTLERWKQVPEFKARVEELLQSMREAIMAKGIADKRNRILRLDHDWTKLKTIPKNRAAYYIGIRDRIIAEAEKMRLEKKPDAEIEKLFDHPCFYPGMTTGFMLHRVDVVGPKGHAIQVDVYEFDSSLESSLRAIEMQAAKEMGQLVDKADVTSGGKTVAVIGYTITPPTNGDGPGDTNTGRADPIHPSSGPMASVE